MGENEVRLSGTVKRDAQAGMAKGCKVLDFAIQVPSQAGRLDIFDCRLTDQSDAYSQLEGFVEGGEELTVIGHLEKRTTTESQRIAGAFVEVRTTAVIVYVDAIEDE